MVDALFSVDVPEEDGWRDDVAARVLYLIFAALVFKLGIRLWAVAESQGPAAAIPTAISFAVGIMTAGLAISDVDFHRHGRKIGYGAVIVLALLTIITSYLGDWPVRLGTDALAFTSYGVELLADGVNPMATSMAPATDLPGAPDKWTWRVDGSKVVSWSYPAGVAFAYLPQFLLIGRSPIGIRLTSILGVAALGVVLIRVLPAVYSPAALAVLMVPRPMMFSAAGGLIDMWWVIPTCITLVLWYQERFVAAAAVLGVAGATKQQPWAIGPFLGVWLWHERDSISQFVELGGKCVVAGLTTFVGINLPFILWNPQAWVESVFIPLNVGGQAPLVSTGVGAAALSTAGIEIPHSLFKLLLFAMLGVLLIGYWRYFDRIKWVAFLAPQIVLFWAPRSLPSYFTFGIPVALLALFAMDGTLLDDTRPEVYDVQH